MRVDSRTARRLLDTLYREGYVQRYPTPGRPGPTLRADGAAAAQAAHLAPKLRTVTCNPPYVRVQRLSSPQREEADLAMSRSGAYPAPPGRIFRNSNYHVYFWWHAARFLADDGRLVFITSGEWLDSDHGAPMQQWLLDNFRILLFVESLAEPWFSEARVGTVVCAAQRCRDSTERDTNTVRWIALRQPLQRLYGPAQSPSAHFNHVDALRDRLLAVTGFGEAEDFDWKTITQASLRAICWATSNDSR